MDVLRVQRTIIRDSRQNGRGDINKRLEGETLHCVDQVALMEEQESCRLLNLGVLHCRTLLRDAKAENLQQNPPVAETVLGLTLNSLRFTGKYIYFH